MTNTDWPPCPKCHSSRVRREYKTVTIDGKRLNTSWYSCLDCWHKWDGRNDAGLPYGEDGIEAARYLIR